MVSSSNVSKNDGDSLSDPTEYKGLAGALQYMVFTLPDIAYAVNRICQFMHSPTNVHMAALKRILRYLCGTIDFGVVFRPSTRLSLSAYADANWGLDFDDQRSTSGFYVYFGSTPVSWVSKKQQVVVKSEDTPTVWCDSSGAVAVAANPVLYSKFKHVELDLFFIRERLADRFVLVGEVSACDQERSMLSQCTNLGVVTCPATPHTVELVCLEVYTSSVAAKLALGAANFRAFVACEERTKPTCSSKRGRHLAICQTTMIRIFANAAYKNRGNIDMNGLDMVKNVSIHGGIYIEETKLEVIRIYCSAWYWDPRETAFAMEANLADLTLNEDEDDVLQIQTDSNTVRDVEEYNLVRHSDSFCASKMELGVEIKEMGWDLSLQAQSRRALTMNSVWLREEGETSRVSKETGSNTGHGRWEGLKRPGIIDPVLGFNPGGRSACQRVVKESMMEGQSQTAMDHDLEDEVVVGEERKKRARGDMEESINLDGRNRRSKIEKHQLSVAAKGQADRSQ
ncbi:hypothetical protein EPI10_032718 [Gossypium australe]|uniref:Uncharacterized protein n=1 Tax=Gossypium australe TaxID=47621 RepID=A0A5B6X4C6_9ROSI|nr:hypothetical protein EPI10_032718 [Gossypium australe]